MRNYIAGVRSTNLNFQDSPIGGRLYMPNPPLISFTHYLGNFIEFLVIFLKLFVILPIITVYLLDKLGFRKTIKLFKRMDREANRKNKFKI